MTAFFLTKDDPRYPDSLRQISDPPEMLWGEGSVESLSALSNGALVAIVGSRECTPYGRKAAFELAKGLGENGVTVVSGLAYGIDAAAHDGALKGGGKTVAVLGCGIDVPYPAKNQILKKEIISNGAVITELEPGTSGTNWTFPKRNRIISGLSRGVVVVEAAAKSGALITADLALQQGRDVFAVPGDIHSKMSEGTHRLIQQGAKLVATVRDILEELNLNVRQKEIPLIPPSSKEAPVGVKKGGEGGFPETPEEKVLSLLSEMPRHVDELIASTQIPLPSLSEILVQLEIDGKITALPGSCFARNEV